MIGYCFFAWGVGVGRLLTRFYESNERPTKGDFVVLALMPILLPVSLLLAEYIRRSPPIGI